MYKKTDPQQCLFGVETQLSASLKARLKNSWAELFCVEILPILLKSEDQKRFSQIPKHIQKWHQREPDGWFGLGQVQRKQNLKELATYLDKLKFAILNLFAVKKEGLISQESLCNGRPSFSICLSARFTGGRRILSKVADFGFGV